MENSFLGENLIYGRRFCRVRKLNLQCGAFMDLQCGAFMELFTERNLDKVR